MPSTTSLPNLSLARVDQGRLFLISRIERGSFGGVYTALGPRDPGTFNKRPTTQTPLTRIYAVKVLPPKPAPSTSRDQERRLHRAVSEHPGIATLHHTFEEDGMLYLVMVCPTVALYGICLSSFFP